MPYSQHRNAKDTMIFPAFKEITPTTLNLLLITLQDHINTALKNTPFTWDTLIPPLEDAADAIEKLWAPFSHLHAVNNSPELRDSYEACLPLLTAFETQLYQNKALYEAIASINTTPLTPTQQKIIQDKLRDFELSGVALSDEAKQRFEAIDMRLAELGTQFENNLIDTELAFELLITDASRLKGLPQHTLDTAAHKATEKNLTGYLLGLDYPCFHAVVTYAKDRSLRETFYRAYITRASELGDGRFDNGPLLKEILQLRQEQAQLLGFPHYAALSLMPKMASSAETVLTFLNDLLTQTRPQAINEFKTLQDFAKTELTLPELAPWDIAFASAQKKQHDFDFSEESLRAYFPSHQVWAGLETILKALYGITLTPIKNVETWHKNVECLQVTDETGITRGYLYVDLFARPHKRGGAWMDLLQTKRAHQLPIATLTCNFAPPQAGQEAFFLHEEVLTLFHELGHCLHHLLTKITDFSASGIHGVEWDAVELPSQFFENWCWDADMLGLLTQNKLPQDKLKALRQTQTFQAGLALLRQLEFSLFDMRIHSEVIEPQAILNEIRQTTQLLPALPENRFPNSFSHIFAGGYGAGYYSYLWAEVLSADAFARFEEEGILNPDTGRAFLRAILEVGSSQSATSAFQTFRGREPDPKAFLRHRGLV